MAGKRRGMFKKRSSKRRKLNGFKSRSRTRGLRTLKTVGISRGNFLPAYTYVKLEYRSELNEYNTSGINGETAVYRMNSVFDPEAALGGGQPIGFDQLAAKYSYYQVYGAKIVFTGSNGQSGGGGIAEVQIGTSLQLGATTWKQLNLQAGTKSKLITALGSARSVVKMSMFRRCRNVFGVTRKQYADSQYAALTIATPIRECFFHVQVRGFDRSTAPSIKGDVKIFYYCKFFQPKPLVEDV